jgi:prophage tail gpP-like protein
VSKVVLGVNGFNYGGWKAIRIVRGMEQIAGTFDLTVSERWPGQDTARPIRPGDACTVSIDADIVITGYVDDFNPGYDATSHQVRVAGRDKTGDLVDCSAIYKTGHWLGQKLDKIAKDLCGPFGIGVVVETDVGEKFSEFAIQEGETVFECLERAAKMRGVLLTADGKGGLVITRAGTQKAGVSLEKGVNVLRADGQFSHKDRYSSYTIKGQRRGTDDDWLTPESITEVSGGATDSGVKRYRPLIVLGEDQGDGGAYQQRVDWERNTRLGKSIRSSITVQGWREKGDAGALWTPNRLIPVKDDWQGLDAELIISGVTYSLDEQGTTTTLDLTHPSAFAQEPPKSSGSGKSGSRTNDGDWL